jgi:hypothetical protein
MYNLLKKSFYQISKFGLNSRSTLFKKKEKKKEILFILGSGNSINDIVNWSIIRENHSIGFNYFFLHDFIPNFYLIETPTTIQRERSALQIQLLLKNFYKFKRTKNFILHGKGYKNLVRSFKENSIKFNLYSHLDFLTKNIDELKKILNNKKLINILKYFFALSQGCSSLERIVLDAYFSGYKKIVLCGVDLQNSFYFYEYEKFLNNKKIDERQLICSLNLETEKLNLNINNLHKTNNPNLCKGSLTVEDVLVVYNEILFKNSTKIFVSNKNSKLAKYFDIFSL